jgi:hypothetical protein
MPAEPLLLNLDKDTFNKLYRAAEKGDQQARDSILNMWNEHRDKEIVCFLCDSTECSPIHMQVLPERDPKSTLLLCAALCLRCRELPVMVKMSRSLKILRRMWGVKGFYFTPQRHHHPTR